MGEGRVDFEVKGVIKTGYWRPKDMKAGCASNGHVSSERIMDSAIRVFSKAQSSQVIAEQAPNARPYH
jgi:hypothetical protein